MMIEILWQLEMYLLDLEMYKFILECFIKFGLNN
jgi:hypothetical protein